MMNIIVWESYLRSEKLELSLESEGKDRKIHKIRSEQEHTEHPEKFKH